MTAQSEETKAHERARHKVWYEAHRDEQLAKQKAYRESHREQVAAAKKKCYEARRDEYIAAVKANYRAHPAEKAAASRAYREAHLDQIKVRKTAYYQAHREEIRPKLEAYRQTHKKEMDGYLVRWRAQHPERWREILEHHRIKRRGLLAGRVCDLTASQWRAIQAAQEYKCAACGEVKPLTKDHIVPIARGGHHTASNIQGLCQSCNSRKNARIIDYRLKRHAEWEQLRLTLDM